MYGKKMNVRETQPFLNECSHLFKQLIQVKYGSYIVTYFSHHLQVFSSGLELTIQSHAIDGNRNRID